MPSLQQADDRFTTTFEVIDGGSGTFRGVLSEPGQGEVPSYQFNLPRRLLRVEPHLPIKAGMVVRSPSGQVFIVGSHGIADGIFKSFRLFEATNQFTWKRRTKTTDTVTGLEKDAGLQDMGPAWGAYEPGTQEAFDRQMRTNFETGRFITNKPVQRDDIIDSRHVTRSDAQLGIYIVTLG